MPIRLHSKVSTAEQSEAITLTFLKQKGECIETCLLMKGDKYDAGRRDKENRSFSGSR